MDECYMQPTGISRQNAAPQSVHLTLGAAHRACALFKQFPTPELFSLDCPSRTGLLDGFAVPALVVD